MVDYLNTEISTSKQKKFSLVTFVDTPGLVDGDMKYPFDVNESIEWLGMFFCRNRVPYSTLTNDSFSLGELADLIFVFFDPIGRNRASAVQENPQSRGTAKHPSSRTPSVLSL